MSDKEKEPSWSNEDEEDWSEEEDEEWGEPIEREVIPEVKKVFDLKYVTEYYEFGNEVFKPMTKPEVQEEKFIKNTKFIKPLFEKTVLGFAKLRGQRGQMTVYDMIVRCYNEGLFTLSGSINRLIIPAIKYILNEINKLKKDNPKRKTVLTELADAFQDCQQVQARVILKLYSDLTNQLQTFEKQILYLFMGQKSQSLNEFITIFHADCDLDHTKVRPSKQRDHLYSAYLDMVGGELGMEGIDAAREDRFLGETISDIRTGVWEGVSREIILKAIKNRIYLKQFVEYVLADINCQSDNADRLIDRDLVFKWVDENIKEDKMRVFYNEERTEEYKLQDPSKPLEKNKYQPFLSLEFLVKMLEKMEYVKRK